MRDFAASFVDKQALTIKLWYELSELQGYDALEVWRSTVSKNGPYQELTSVAWRPASLTSTRCYGTLVGKSLVFLVNEVTQTITFTGCDPLTPADAASQINTQGAGLLLATVDSEGDLQVATTAVGHNTRLQLIDGDAATVFGWSVLPPSNTAFGLSIRMPLSSTQRAYTFTDAWYQSSYFYKTRLRNTTTGALSDFCDPIRGNPTQALTADQLIRGWVRLVDLQGRPVPNRQVIFSALDTVHNLLVDGTLIDAEDQYTTTDATGYASLILVRGVPISVAIANTALVRDVTPPTDPTLDSFNLFDPNVGSDDAFTVQVPDILLAERVTYP